MARMVVDLEDAGFEVRDVESLREHYALPCAPGAPTSTASWDARSPRRRSARARVWRLYMTASAMSFESNDIGVNQVLAVRPDEDGRSGFPLTRRRLLGVDADRVTPRRGRCLDADTNGEEET